MIQYTSTYICKQKDSQKQIVTKKKIYKRQEYKIQYTQTFR